VTQHDMLDAGVRRLRELGARAVRHDGERVVLFRGPPARCRCPNDTPGALTRVIVASIDPWVASETTPAMFAEMARALEEACLAWAAGKWELPEPGA